MFAYYFFFTFVAAMFLRLVPIESPRARNL